MNVNKYICTGRLTSDPELRALPTGTSVCEMRLAVGGMGRRGEVGFINLSVYGSSGEACARYLTKGAKIAVDGRIEYGEWDADTGKRHEHRVIADAVEFLTPRSSEQELQPERGSKVRELVAA
jgi:single-strand DNA-binding protein